MTALTFAGNVTKDLEPKRVWELFEEMTQIYRASDEGSYGQKLSNEQIAQVLQINAKTVERIKQRFVEDGFDACMDRKPYPKKGPIKTDGDFEAHLIALSCSEAPEGYARWSLRLLADKMIELKYADSISHETVRQVLKKTKLNRGGSKAG